MKIDTRPAELPPTNEGVMETRADVVRVFSRDGTAFDVRLANDGIAVSTLDGTLDIFPTAPDVLEITLHKGVQDDDTSVQ